MSYVEAAATAAQMQTLSATFASLGQELTQGASSGDFQDVLAQMRSALDSLAGAATVVSSATPATSTTAAADATAGTALATAPLSAATSPVTAASSQLGLGSTGTTTEAYAATGAGVVADAGRYLGVPYVWGGTTPAGFDCSGLVQHVYADVGVSLPRTADEQAQVGTPVASVADAQPGDLVFFPGSDGTAADPGHVGIYIGDNQMIVAPHTGTDVQIQSVGDPTEIRRILPTATTALADPSTDDAALPANLDVPASLVPLFDAAGETAGVSPALLAAVAKEESGFQTGAVSGAGAEGLMQLMPAAAASLGVDPLDPAQAIGGAAVMLRSYLDRFGGSVKLALAAYNAGPAAVEAYGGVPPYAQTQSYVAAITSLLAQEPT